MTDESAALRPTSLVVGIAGGSGAGKTTLVEAVAGLLPEGAASLLRHDDYYHDRADLPPEKRARLDFDVPSALDNRLLAVHIRALKADKAIPYGIVVQVMAEIKGAGVEQLGMITEPAIIEKIRQAQKTKS